MHGKALEGLASLTLAFSGPGNCAHVAQRLANCGTRWTGPLQRVVRLVFAFIIAVWPMLNSIRATRQEFLVACIARRLRNSNQPLQQRRYC